jgi:hypothetical protein
MSRKMQSQELQTPQQEMQLPEEELHLKNQQELNIWRRCCGNVMQKGSRRWLDVRRLDDAKRQHRI